VNGAVLAVGDELLLGDIVNSNAAWLGEQLAAVGVQVVSSAMVGDDVERLATALRRSLDDAEVVVLTGGLGPTADDRTRDALALVARAPLERQPRIEEQLRQAVAAYGFPLLPAVLQQADVPRGAEVIDNPVGTAPGLWLELGGKVVVALPGPPHEMRETAGLVLPRLADLSGTRVVTRQVKTAGLGESQVAGLVEQAVEVPEGVVLAYLAGGGVVRVRFTTAGDPAVLEPLVQACVDALGEAVWGQGEATLDGVVHELLSRRGATVGVAESLTGGLLGAALSQRPGSSTTFRGGLVAYASDLKQSLAGVAPEVLARYGAVAPETALALAEGARVRTWATWGVATTGVAGPTEQEGKAVGTVHVAVSGPGTEQVRSLRLPGDRERVRTLAVTAALDLLRRQLGKRPE
jgi:nicotinamide-nucleotide amidase